MLSRVNNFWRFKSEEELNNFLNAAQESNDEYQLQNFGLSTKGDYYAYGTVIFHTKFGEKTQQAQETEVKTELNLG